MALVGRNVDRGHIARQVTHLLMLLKGHRYMPSHQWLADEMGVCTRTVRRYLDAVEHAGWPLPKRGWNTVKQTFPDHVQNA